MFRSEVRQYPNCNTSGRNVWLFLIENISWFRRNILIKIANKDCIYGYYWLIWSRPYHRSLFYQKVNSNYYLYGLCVRPWCPAYAIPSVAQISNGFFLPSQKVNSNYYLYGLCVRPWCPAYAIPSVAQISNGFFLPSQKVRRFNRCDP